MNFGSRRRDMAALLTSNLEFLEAGHGFEEIAPSDDLISSQVGADQLLFVIVHAGDDFDVTVEQIEFLRNHHPGARVAIVDTHYRLDDVVAATVATIQDAISQG